MRQIVADRKNWYRENPSDNGLGRKACQEGIENRFLHVSDLVITLEKA